VKLLDINAGWKYGCLKGSVEQMTFLTVLKNIEWIGYFKKSGRLFQIVGAATRKARDAVTVLTRCVTISKSELDERSVLAGLYKMSESSK